MKRGYFWIVKRGKEYELRKGYIDSIDVPGGIVTVGYDKRPEGWAVSELTTGFGVHYSFKSKAAAVDYAVNNSERLFETVNLPVNAEMVAPLQQWSSEHEADIISAMEADKAATDSRVPAKKNNNGQPVNLAQLKRALCIGAEFIIKQNFPGAKEELRRVNDTDTTSIYSIVPFDATAKATTANNFRGSWLQFRKASFWRFENGECSCYHSDKPEEQTGNNRVFSIRLVEKEPGRDEAFESWMNSIISERKEQFKGKQELAEKEAEKNNQEQIETIVNPALDIFRNGGEIDASQKVKVFDSEGFKEQNLILYIAEKYGVNIPLKLKGWINKNLAKVIVKEGHCVRVYRYGGPSKTIFTYLESIISAILSTDNCRKDAVDTEDADDELIRHFFGEDTGSNCNGEESDNGGGETGNGDTIQKHSNSAKNPATVPCIHSCPASNTTHYSDSESLANTQAQCNTS